MADRADKFQMEPRIVACVTCIHKHAGSATCNAFPDKIPDEILSGKNLHLTPYPGDNGIQFTPRQDNR